MASAKNTNMAAVRPTACASSPSKSGSGTRPKSEEIACTAPARPGTRAKALALPIGHTMAQRKLKRDVDLACVNV